MCDIQNVFVSGGCASFPNFTSRLRRELVAVRPFQSAVRVTAARDAVIDSWRGARRSAMTDTLYVSAAEYGEKGGDYLREHCASNRYLPLSSNDIYTDKH